MVAKKKFFGGSVQHVGDPHHIGVHDAGASFLKISVCGEGYVQPVGHFFLGYLACFSYLSDVLFDRSVVHDAVVLCDQDKIMG